jgi:UMF1 family MFS transporter
LILNGLSSGVGVLEGTNYPCSAGEELKKNGTLTSIPSCMVKIGELSIATSSYANYVISFSVFLQAILYISIASFGDYGNWRKKFLIIFGLLGCFSAMAMPAAYQPSLFWLAGLFVVFVNLFQGSSYVFLDGFFPILVRNDPKVRSKEESFDEKANKVSMIGNTTGFATSILFQAIALLVMKLISDELMILQLMITATGVWWFFLGIYTFIYLKERPGPPLPKGYSNYILFSWTTVIKSIAKWRKIPNTFLYLLAFFFYSDGMHTLSQIAILFCSEKLKLSNTETIVVSTIFPISALIGNIALVYIQKVYKISTKTMLLSTLSAMSVVPLYALIGAFNDKFGLVHKEEAYVVAL